MTKHYNAAKGQPANMALHLTPVNVAKMHDYNHSFRLAKAVLASLGAGELERSLAL